MTAPTTSYSKRGFKPGYKPTAATRARMRESSRKRWADPKQHEQLARARTFVLPTSRIKRLYEQGLNMRQIGELLGVHAQTICKHMKSHGIQARAKGTVGHHWDEAHHHWKGDAASYQALHTRLHRRRGLPQHCEVCHLDDPNKTYDWANLTGKYADISDYKRMCRSCHRRYDIQRRKA